MRIIAFVVVAFVALTGACSKHATHAKRASGGVDVWVSNDEDGTVTGIDSSKDVVAAVVKVGQRPAGMAASADGKWLYVAVQGAGAFADEEDGVAVVDVKRRSLARTVKVGDAPSAVAIEGDGRTLLATNRASARVSAVDTGGRMIGSVDVGADPIAIATSSDAKGAWVAASNLVSVVDPATMTSIAALEMPAARSIAFSSDGALAYIAAIDGLHVVDARAFMPAGTLPIVANAVATSEAAIAAVTEHGLAVVRNARIERTIAEAGGADVAIANDKAYVVDGRSVVVVDLESGDVVARIRAGRSPMHVIAIR
jgi:DNA-binding beta-propeller fold protein YncE